MKAWNSTLKASRNPMRRKAPMRTHSPLRSNQNTTRWRSNRRKNKIAGHHDAKMLSVCRGQPCFLRVTGVCLGASGVETVVPCHANWSEYGKGMGLKAKDKYTVPGCAACHMWLDQGPEPQEIKRITWEAAYRRWVTVRAGLGV